MACRHCAKSSECYISFQLKINSSMRICILTQPLEKNYGGILQAYALQKALSDMGHQVTTLRFKPLYAQSSSKVGLYWKTFRRFLSKLKGNKSIIYCNPEEQWKHYREINRSIESFINDNINCLEANVPLKLKHLPPFDAFIVGSDQVWRPVFSPCLKNFFLDFLKEEKNKNVKRLAYAASFGVDEWDISEKTTKDILPLAQRFDKISVREESGIELCKSHLEVVGELMPDPTMLLSQEDYLKLCNDFQSNKGGRPYVATYFIDRNKSFDPLVSDFARKHDLDVVPVGGFNWKKGSIPIEQWISGIANAECVITDSFHGSVFSLIFLKDFITFNNSWRGTSRFETLFKVFDMNDRLTDPNGINGIDIPPIDKEQVTRILKSQKEKGLSFLYDSLAYKDY